MSFECYVRYFYCEKTAGTILIVLFAYLRFLQIVRFGHNFLLLSFLIAKQFYYGPWSDRAWLAGFICNAAVGFWYGGWILILAGVDGGVWHVWDPWGPGQVGVWGTWCGGIVWTGPVVTEVRMGQGSLGGDPSLRIKQQHFLKREK